MPIPLTVPLVLSAIRAVMRCRGRVDQVLSLSTAAEGLPFRLPPVPDDPAPFRDPMRNFFRGTDQGKSLLALHGLTDRFKAFDDTLTSGMPIIDSAQIESLLRCMTLYFEASDIDPKLLHPEITNANTLRGYASTGPSEDMRLAYYVVESDRLSRNPALTRIILISADTLLEFLGENASEFIANPKTRGLMESLIDEFAVKHDFDDESAQEIFHMLAGATMTAVLDHPEVLPNKPALVALYGAINDVRLDLKTNSKYSDQKAYDLLAGLLKREGMERIAKAYMVRAAKDPAFISNSELGRSAISAALTEMIGAMDASGDFSGAFADEATRYRIIEAVIEVGANHVAGLLQKKSADGKPFTAVVLTSVVTCIQTEANKRQLFGDIAKGDIYGDIYAVALAAVAGNAKALTTEADVSPVVTELIGALASSLVNVPLTKIADEETRNKLLSSALRVLASHPEVLTKDRQYASQVVAAILAAAADGAADGLTKADMEPILDAALIAAGENAGLAGFSEAQAAVIQAVTAALADADLPELARPSARKNLLLAALAAVNANPKVWTDGLARDLFQGIFAALIGVAKIGRSRQLLSEPTMVEAVRSMLIAVSRRGQAIIERGQAGPDDLTQILTKALDLADAQLGRTVDHEEVPGLLERVVLEYCKAPFVVVGGNQAKIDQFFDGIQQWLKGR